VTEPPIKPPGPPPPPPPPGEFAAPGGTPTRPQKVTAGAVLLFVVGGIAVLYSLLGFLAVGTISDVIEGLEGAGTFLAVLTGVFVLLLILGVLQIVAGARVLPLHRGGRILGIVATGVSLLLWLLVLISGLSQGGADAVGFVVAMLSIGGDIAILILMAQSSDAFATAPLR
jgi:hypothetical protein